MAILKFPPVSNSDEHGLLALGGDLEIDSLLLAYKNGIFPWPINDQYPLAWFSPDPRGVLFFDQLHLSKSMGKLLKKKPYEIKFNTNFEAVIMNCAQVKRGTESKTWITPEIINAYIELFKKGYAYSVECYLNQRLVGGLYGVIINRYCSGESMFYIAPNASKVALISLLYHLQEKNIHWIDTQMVTPVVSSLGGIEIPRNHFLKILKDSLSKEEDL